MILALDGSSIDGSAYTDVEPGEVRSGATRHQARAAPAAGDTHASGRMFPSGRTTGAAPGYG